MSMHYEMLRKIVMAPMSFFQSTPTSDITNKLAVDLKKVDSIVMPNFRNMLYILAITLAFVINVVITYCTNGSYGMVIIFIATILLIGYYYVKFMEALRKLHVIEHALHQAHAAPSGDFFVRKTKLKVHGNPALKSR